MTSVDSGVETGNDSNDSYATLDSQSTTHEVSPVKTSTHFVYTSPQSTINNLEMSKSPSPTEQMNSLVENKETDDGESSQFRPPSQKKCISDESMGPASSIDPPAGLTFLNLEQINLENSYEIIGHKNPEFPDLNCITTSDFLSAVNLRQGSMALPWPEWWLLFYERRLRQAASTNNVDLVAAILDGGVNPNACDEQGRSPLHLAACGGYSEVARVLLEKGADPNRRDILGNTPLHLAACTNSVRVVTALLNAGTDVRSIDYFGRSPLQLAQSKLKLLQKGVTNEDSNLVKEEVRQVIEMMLAYLQKRGQEIEAELLGAFSSRLTLSNTREEVETGVRDLLASLASLSLEKSENDQTKSAAGE
ncbi:hypothetical protein L9F63_002290 [Diploptera punctata]|uniref:Ankyrin repeat domain-containing protein 54 n=1 Tax=Diploptera punctata TaxID=6984 RepID=A0AAD8A494_DIPPU|nr:hypothetical protein L9F63_002290 [Diploptera punctata]